MQTWYQIVSVHVLIANMKRSRIVSIEIEMVGNYFLREKILNKLNNTIIYRFPLINFSIGNVTCPDVLRCCSLLHIF